VISDISQRLLSWDEIKDRLATIRCDHGKGVRGSNGRDNDIDDGNTQRKTEIDPGKKKGHPPTRGLYKAPRGEASR
jgi:hypothetical protein